MCFVLHRLPELALSSPCCVGVERGDEPEQVDLQARGGGVRTELQTFQHQQGETHLMEQERHQVGAWTGDNMHCTNNLACQHVKL